MSKQSVFRNRIGSDGMYRCNARVRIDKVSPDADISMYTQKTTPAGTFVIVPVEAEAPIQGETSDRMFELVLKAFDVDIRRVTGELRTGAPKKSEEEKAADRTLRADAKDAGTLLLEKTAAENDETVEQTVARLLGK